MSEELEPWSWPPPGLERLRGVLRTAARRGALGTACAGSALLWLITAPEIEDSEALHTIVAAAIGFGILSYLGAILRAAAALDLARQGARLGYPRALLVDVLADGGEDTPDLVAGTGSYAELRPRIRATMRALRRVAAFTGLAGALLPLPLLCVGFWLALRGAAAPLSVWLLLLAPALLLWLATAILRGYALLLAQWERGAAAWDPAPISERERAEAWRRRFTPEDAERRGQRPRGLLALTAAAGSGVVAFVFLFVTVSLAGLLAGWTGERGYAAAELGAVEAARIEAARSLRVATDSGITSGEAARALHALLAAAGDTAVGMRTPDPRHPALWPDVPLRTGYAPLWQWLSAEPTPPPAAALRDLPPHPALTELRVLARASSVDALAARWDSVPPGDIWYRGGSASAHPAVVRPVADAANAWRRGERLRSRAILADLASAGVLLADHARTAHELRLGAAMAAAGAALLLRTGTSAGEGAGQEAALERTLHRYGVGASAVPTRRLAQRVEDEALAPALRWEALRLAYRELRCGSPGALLFSRAGRDPDWLQSARDALVQTRGDSLAFEALVRRAPPLSSGSRWYRRIERGVRAVSGEHLLGNPCFAAVVRGY